MRNAIVITMKSILLFDKKVIMLSLFILSIICSPFLYTEVVNRSLVKEIIIEKQDMVPSLIDWGSLTGNINENSINLPTQLMNDLKEIYQINQEATEFDFYLSHPFDVLNETFYLMVNFVSDNLWDEFNLNASVNTYILQNPKLAMHSETFMPIIKDIVNTSLGLPIEISYVIGQRLPLFFENFSFPNPIFIFFNIDMLTSNIVQDYSLDFFLSTTINNEYLIGIDTLDEVNDVVNQIHNQILMKIGGYVQIYSFTSPLIAEIQINQSNADEFLIGYLAPIFLIMQFLLFLYIKSTLKKEEDFFLLLLMRGFSPRTLKNNGAFKYVYFPVISSLVFLYPVMIYLSEKTFFRLLGFLITWLAFHLSSSNWLVVSRVNEVSSSVEKTPQKHKKSKFIPKIYFIPVISGVIIIILAIGSFLDIPIIPLFVADYTILTILLVISCILIWQFPLYIIENKRAVRGVDFPALFKLVSKKMFSRHSVLIVLLLSSMIFGYNMMNIQYSDQKDSRAVPREDFQVQINNQVHSVLDSNLVETLQSEENLSALSITSMPLEVIDHYGFSRYFVFNIVNQNEYNQYIQDIGLVNEKNYFDDYFWISDINLQKLSIIPDTSLNILNGNYSRTLPISIFRPFDDQTGITSNNDFSIISSVSTWNKYVFNISAKYEVEYEYSLKILITGETTQAEIENIILNSSNLTVNDFHIRNRQQSEENVEHLSSMIDFAKLVTFLSYMITVLLLELTLVFRTSLIKELSRLTSRFGRIRENRIYVGLFLAYLNVGVIISTLLGMLIYLIDKSRLLIIIHRGFHIIIRSDETVMSNQVIRAIVIYLGLFFVLLMGLVYRRTSSSESNYP